MDLFLIFLLIGINVLVFLFPILLPNFGSQEYLIRAGGVDRSAINDGEYYRLLTSTFLHGDFLHLAVNMLSLFQVGPAIASYFGMVGFLIIYIGSGLSGSLTSAVFNGSLSVGASGAIFGLIGALLSIAIFRNEPSLLANLVFVIAINLFLGFSSGGRIDNWGHLGGLFGGFLIGTILLFSNSNFFTTT
jgi:rhomboid protease GluP